MARESDWHRHAMTKPHRQSLPERLGDGPVFLFAWICAGAWLFIVATSIIVQGWHLLPNGRLIASLGHELILKSYRYDESKYLHWVLA